MKNRAFLPLPLKPNVISGFAFIVANGHSRLRDAVAACIEAVLKKDPEYDPNGLQTRITWEINDAVCAYRSQVAFALRELKVLVARIMNRQGDPRSEMIRRHKELGAPLTDDELRQILDDEAEIWVSRQRSNVA